MLNCDWFSSSRLSDSDEINYSALRLANNPGIAVDVPVFVRTCVDRTGSREKRVRPNTQAAPTVPIFEDGEAQIVDGFKNPKDWIRHDLWVETEFDSDDDGGKDRMHVSVTRQKQTDTEGLKVPVVYVTSPYFAGTGSTDKQFMWNPEHELGAGTARPRKSARNQVSKPAPHDFRFPHPKPGSHAAMPSSIPVRQAPDSRKAARRLVVITNHWPPKRSLTGSVVGPRATRRPMETRKSKRSGAQGKSA